MRHAKSDWKHPGLADHDRPLNKRGRRAAPLMANRLNDSQIEVDVILASSARRVQETLELMRPIWGAEAELFTEPSLYAASPEQICRHIRGLHDSWRSAMVVGHNPGMVALVCHLSGRDLDMPTAAVAIFQTGNASWSQTLAADWQLTAFWKPRELEA
jgi:phosphohistidine phosphatase